MDAMKKLGQGILMWEASERRSGRYGSVYLTNASYDGRAMVSVEVDEKAIESLLGHRVKLVAKVIKARKSGHVGDLSLKIFPKRPMVGEEISLGVGLFETKVGFDGSTCFVLYPHDGRSHFWIDPRTLYRLHDQTIALFGEVTGEPFTVVDLVMPTDAAAFDTGDGHLQVRNMGSGEEFRVIPRIERIDRDTLIVDDSPPGFGREVPIDVRKKR